MAEGGEGDAEERGGGDIGWEWRKLAILAILD